MSDPVRGLVELAGRLRVEGVGVPTDRVVTLCRALALLPPGDPEAHYWAAAATLTSGPAELAALDRALGRATAPDPVPVAPGPAPAPGLARLAAGARAGGRGDAWPAAKPADGDRPASLRVVASRREALRARSFDQLTPAEREEIAGAIRRLAVRLPERPARRRSPARHGVELDLRRTVRLARRTAGEPVRRAWRTRRPHQRPLVLLLDVSASMSAYSRPLLLFGHTALAAGADVEVFCFGTRLTRVTPALAARHAAGALAAAGALVADWSGGTRIGDSLRALLSRYGGSGLLRGAVVVLCSDGLDRGDPAELAAQVSRLARLAHRLVWVNPLKGSPRYEPLARGMAAALPHVSVFLPGHNLASLEQLCAVLAEP